MSSTNLFVDNQCISSTPSKLEGVPEGRGRVSGTLVESHTPPALRATSPSLGEDLCVSNLFSSNSP